MTKNFVCKTSSLTRPMLPLMGFTEPHFEQTLEAARLAVIEFQRQRLSIIPDASNYHQYARTNAANTDLHTQEHLQTVGQALNSLDCTTRQIFELYRNAGMQRAAIAAKLELSRAEVDAGIEQVLQTLQKCALS